MLFTSFELLVSSVIYGLQGLVEWTSQQSVGDN